MARITVEDCLEKIDSQYDLVLLAKERASQLNAGEKALVPQDNDKNTVLALREIGDGKISLKTLEDSAINKLRKIKNQVKESEDLDIDQEDDFDKIYKGEISKSGAAILPSKRARRLPEKIITAKSNEEKEITAQDKQITEKDSIPTDNEKDSILTDNEKDSIPTDNEKDSIPTDNEKDSIPTDNKAE